MSKTRAPVLISGFVQGIGFRFFAILNARKPGLSASAGTSEMVELK